LKKTGHSTNRRSTFHCHSTPSRARARSSDFG
jgi:hypothetical protein